MIVSLHDDKAIAAQAKEAGAHAYVVKASPSEGLVGHGLRAGGAHLSRVVTGSPAG